MAIISTKQQIMAKQTLALTSANHSKQSVQNKIAGHTNIVTPPSVGNA